MKFRELKKWVDVDNSEGLIFFAQLMEELLFDYSLDTYKPSAMNTSVLCLEAIHIIKEIDKENINQNSLKHILEELVLNLKSDMVAKSLITLEISNVVRVLEDDGVSTVEKKTTLEMVYGHINLQDYKKRNEELLLDTVVRPSRKKLIRALTRSYVTTLVNLGYSTHFMYITNRMFFHISKNPISGQKSLKQFFKIFTGSSQKYTAIIKSNRMFLEIKTACKVFNIDVKTKIPLKLQRKLNGKTIETNNKDSILVVNNLPSMDVYSARLLATKKVEDAGALLNLFHHKESVKWDDEIIMLNQDSGKVRNTSKLVPSILMCVDTKLKNAANELNSFLMNFSMKSDDFSRYHNAAELHSLALRSDSHENQLLNLWVALETIVPSKVGNKSNKVSNIIQKILPILTLSYLPTLTNKLEHDIYVYDKDICKKYLSKVKCKASNMRLMNILLLDEYNEDKKELYNDMGDFHLLRNRAFYFSEALSSSSKIKKLLEAHWQRVDWQIRRIYRTRNLIVHSGYTPPNIDILIKNTHDYLDVILNTIGKLASEDRKFNSIDTIFNYTDMKYAEYNKLLSVDDVKTTKSNMKELLYFGLID